MAQDEFSKAFKQASKIVQKASVATLNKAAGVAKTQFMKDIADISGLKLKQISTRTFVNRATQANPSASVVVGTKYGIDATYFAPVEGSVSIVRKGATKARSYQKVSVKAPGLKRFDLPGAFLAKAQTSNSIRVFTRLTDKRLPLGKVLLDSMLPEAARQAQPAAQTKLLQYYQANLQPTIGYFLGQANNITLEDGDDGPA